MIFTISYIRSYFPPERVKNILAKFGGLGAHFMASILGVDIEKKEVLLPTYGGYSGPAIRPIGLAAVSTMAQAVNIPISGIGGITQFNHALEYMMLGATTIQMCTGLILNGVSHIKNILEDLEFWMDKKGYDNIEDIRGIALKSLKSYEEIKIEPYGIKSVEFQCAIDCDKCIKACAYETIIKNDDKISVESKRCTGCGLCVSVCHKKNFSLEWINNK